MTVYEIVADVASRLEARGIRYVIGGSLASSAWGQQRYTNDADIAILIDRSQVETLRAAFGDPYLLSSEDIESALSSPADFRAIQLMHLDEAFKIDLFVLRPGPYELSELERAEFVTVAPGIIVRFCAAENIVIAKLRWYVLGNRVSDRQWNDIVQVLEVQSGKLDEAYLERWSAHFGVDDLLAAARAQAYF